MELKKQNLIVVDDDPAALAQITQITQGIGLSCTVRSTCSVSRAISWLESDPGVGWIIAEQMLKQGRGLAVLKLAHQARPEVRRILATRYIDLTDLVEGVHCGVIHKIVSKPYGAREVQGALAEHPVLPAHAAGAGHGAAAGHY